jgi:hypothetical protein
MISCSKWLRIAYLDAHRNGPYINQILGDGQSLARGSHGYGPLSTNQPYSNVMLDSSSSSLVPLTEPATGADTDVESMSSSMANSLTTLVPGHDYRVAVTLNGVGATAYKGLKKGTRSYTEGLDEVAAVNKLTRGLELRHRVIAITWLHGESDMVDRTSMSEYEADLVEMQHNGQHDIKRITHQTNDVTMFIDQTSSQTAFGLATSPIPQAQWEASVNNPGKIILVCPLYFFDYTDGIHLINKSYRWLAAYFAKAIKKQVVDGQSWVPLSPKSVIIDGSVIYLRCNVPVGPLRVDTNIVSARANDGFEYADDSSSAVITNVSLLDGDTIKIMLNTVPTGDHQELRYAYTGTPGALAHSAGGVGGNIRDSDPATDMYGDTLFNWMAQFSEPIVPIERVSDVKQMLSTK